MSVVSFELFSFDQTHYAEHCLNMVAAPTDQESRSIQRKMVAKISK
jgi:hypothetical protein